MAGEMEENGPYADLKRRVEITRDARFQANLRLERRQKASYFVISILSLFVIVLSLIPNVFSLNSHEQQALLSLTIVNSVFVIITTFLEASGNFVHKGEQLHQSARKIASVFHKLMLLNDDQKFDQERIGNLQEEYQAALDDCPFNHDSLDYDLIKTTKPSLFPNRVYEGRGKALVTYIMTVRYRVFEYSWLIPHLLVVAISSWLVFSLIPDNGLQASSKNTEFVSGLKVEQ